VYLLLYQYIAIETGSLLNSTKSLNNGADYGWSLALRLSFLLAVVVLSTFVVRLLGLRFIAGPLLLAGLFLTSAALLFGPLAIAITPLTVVRLVLATPFSFFIFGFVHGIFGLGRSGLGFGTRTSGPGCRTLAARARTTATTWRSLLPLL